MVNKKKNLKFIGSVKIPANTETFDPKIIFAESDPHEKDGAFVHIGRFKKYLFEPSKIVGNVPAQNFDYYESESMLTDKKIRSEIGEEIITPDELWVTWKRLIFKQLLGKPGLLRVDGPANAWYVRCYDGVVRIASCRRCSPFDTWTFSCLGFRGRWVAGPQFFVKGKNKKV